MNTIFNTIGYIQEVEIQKKDLKTVFLLLTEENLYGGTSKMPFGS